MHFLTISLINYYFSFIKIN